MNGTPFITASDYVEIVVVFAVCPVFIVSGLYTMIKGQRPYGNIEGGNLNQSFVSDVSFIEVKFCLFEPAIYSITVLAQLDWRCHIFSGEQQ